MHLPTCCNLHLPTCCNLHPHNPYCKRTTRWHQDMKHGALNTLSQSFPCRITVNTDTCRLAGMGRYIH